jgi:valyl-tRNA synthetase
MANVRDWCISRQLWWGQRIPAYYLPTGEFVVAETTEEALKLAQEKNQNYTLADLRQDEDVLDTWFSSALWPISVFDGLLNSENEDIKYYYPTNDLVTAPEILFFWVARMILMGYEYKQTFPYENVYLTGIVRDKQGRKMSKSLGNSPDPLDLIDKYSADGVRTGMLFSSPAGNDLRFDESLCEQGRNFANKIWNAFRLIKGWDVTDTPSAQNDTAIQWFEARWNDALAQIEEHYENYRISDALVSVYKLIWDDFCSWYLEMIKPPYQQPIDKATYQKTIAFFEDLMKLLHPFMPFITEELWHEIQERAENDCIIIAKYPTAKALTDSQKTLLSNAETIFELITQIRNTRNAKGISPKKELPLYIKTSQLGLYEKFGAIIQKLANINQISATSEKVEKAVNFVIKADEFFLKIEGTVDMSKEKEVLFKELEYTKGFLDSVNKKLSNEKFVNNAPPQVLENERKKQADAEAKIKALEESLASL